MLSAKEVRENQSQAVDAAHAKAAKCQDRGQWKAASRHLETARKILERMA